MSSLFVNTKNHQPHYFITANTTCLNSITAKKCRIMLVYISFYFNFLQNNIGPVPSSCICCSHFFPQFLCWWLNYFNVGHLSAPPMCIKFFFSICYNDDKSLLTKRPSRNNNQTLKKKKGTYTCITFEYLFMSAPRNRSIGFCTRFFISQLKN